MRVASPTRVYLPQESSSTMIIERSASVTCMTRHRPASAMYPVLDKPMSQRELQVKIGRRAMRFGHTNKLTRSSRWDIGLSKTRYIAEAGGGLGIPVRVGGRSIFI